MINVIDARQSYLQKIVRAGLEALGHAEEAQRSVHFAYEMVALSAAAARTLGYAAEGDETKVLEMSGRKGIGVKADDLLDRLEEKSREEHRRAQPRPRARRARLVCRGRSPPPRCASSWSRRPPPA